MRLLQGAVTLGKGERCCLDSSQPLHTNCRSLKIIARYRYLAQGVANDFGTSGTTIWLIEPDFFQYSVSGDNHETRFSQLNGGIPDAELCGNYFNDIVATIKAALPNAKIAVDISPWLNEGIVTWYANFDQSKVDYLFTSGGRTQGGQTRIRSDNNNLLTWAGASAAMGGKKIIADDGYGVGGGAEENYDDWMNVDNLNARIADGVIGISIKAPRDAFYTFAAQHPISLGGGGGNSSSSTAQSSSSRPSSSSAAPTPSNLTALIDNFEDGDEFSEWGGEWSTYTDAGDGGQSTVTTSFSTGYNSSKALKASYALKKGNLSYDPQVGITVDLLADKSTVNLNSCTSITYYYKGAAHSVRMESPLVTDYAYHQASAATTNSWTKKTVTLTSMTQPDWSNITVSVDSARQNVKAFSWQVSGTTGATGSLEIDSVRCEGLPEAVSSSSAKSSSSVSSSSARSSSSVSSSSVSSSSVSSSSVSSSSAVSSSGSMGGPCVTFVNGTGDYGDHCYNSGLDDMEPGKCYTMNPERNPAPQWINKSVSETYWWVETSCGEEESSSSSEEVSSSSAIPTYTITFKNGNVTLATVVLEAGLMPAYTGETPTKAATAQYTYSFSGWEPALAEVSGDAVYTAKFAQVLNYYAIQFFNGTELLKTESVAYGTTPVYSGATPTKDEDAGYTYAFDGWTPDLAPVTQAADYVAKFKATKKKYTVTFVDDDLTTVLKAAEEYDFGTMAANIVQPATPTKAANAEYTYQFSGWSPKLVDVVDNITYVATYAETKRKYPVTFVDEDGTILQATAQYDYGTRPANIVTPTDPTKPATAEFTYTFEGWTPAIAMVTGNATYTATYTSTKNKYTVTFVDEDGTVLLAAAEYDYGTVPADIAKPADPVKQGTAGETFAFAGWTPALAAVTEDVVYTATYTSSTNSYTVTFVKDDGTVILTATYPYGTIAADIVKPRTPEKPATEEYTYEFSGWSPKIENVTGNATYTATYTSTKNKYTITFVNGDGTETTAEVEYGTVPVAPEGKTPANTAQYTYTFTGWTPILTQVTGDATYTATFKATVNQYTVTFLNYDNSKLQSSKVAYGEMPAYAGETPTKPASAQYTYNFDGWSPAIAVVKGDASYMAVFREVAVVIPSSSSEEQSSSSEVVESSSSEEQSSSSEVVEESCSSEAESSSSEVVDESSSSEESSNSGAESSSSVEESPCIAFVNGVGGYAEHCYNSGLNNMTAETCYTISPTRPGSLQWMNTDASNREWWAETSCLDFVPPSSSSATTIVSSSSSATAPETFVAGLQSQLKVSFANNCLAIYAPRESLVRVQVFDMLGNRVKTFQETFAGSRDVSLQGLPQGSYMVRVVTGSSAKTSRINIR